MKASESLVVMVGAVAVLTMLAWGPAYGEQPNQPGANDNQLMFAQAGMGQPRTQSGSQNPAISEEELRLRLMLLQRSMGFGGIFAPMLKGLTQGGGSGPSGNGCGGYTDSAACQAYKAGDGWAADRLQRRQSNPAERSWYNR